ncbi:MAG: tRNA pseudouridine(13) synthase TruD [Candidatus Woesearchaeota archaeon]
MMLKHTPNDFIVEEIPLMEWNDTGRFSVFQLIKIGLNTEQAIEIISRRFHIPRELIKYSGVKDKHAHTTQYISIPNKTGISKIRLDEENLKLEQVGYADEPLSLGTLKGNRFIITVRELAEDELAALKNNKKISDHFIIPNYFDEQRFSSNNYNIGLHILKKDYKKAVGYMCESSDIYADTVKIYLVAHPNDYVGALKHVPKKILLMFIHSVQSYMFNEALTAILSDKLLEHPTLHRIVPYSLGNFVYYIDPSKYTECADSLELVGFDTQNMHHNTKKFLEMNGLAPRNFIIKALPDLSVEGTMRECFVNVQNLEIELLDGRAIIQFELPKGAYATNVIRALINSD